MKVAPAGEAPPSGRVVSRRTSPLQVASLPSRFRHMAQPVDRPPRPTTRLEGYVFRRPLSARELLPAIGAGIVTGLAGFYVARLFLERTPLLPEDRRLHKHHATGMTSRRARGGRGARG